MGISTGPEGLLLRLFHRHYRKSLSLLPFLYPTHILGFVFKSLFLLGITGDAATAIGSFDLHSSMHHVSHGRTELAGAFDMELATLNGLTILKSHTGNYHIGQLAIDLTQRPGCSLGFGHTGHWIGAKRHGHV